MAKAPGGTTCSSSGYGEASNTRRCTCEPTTACPRPALRSAAIWTSTTVADRMRALTASHPIKPTSPRCPSAWQPNHGRGSTYRRGKSVQTTGTTSLTGVRWDNKRGRRHSQKLGDESVNVTRLLEQALSLHRAGRLVEAEATYRKILQKYPKNFDARSLLSTLCCQRGDCEQALRHFDLALKINPN